MSATPFPDVGDSSWYLGSVAGGGTSGTITITVQINIGASGTLVNWAKLSYADAAGAAMPTKRASASTVVGEPYMMITKSGLATANPGQTVMYAISYTNVGITSAYDVIITDTYPAGVTFVNANPAPSNPGVGDNIWYIGTVAPGSGGMIFVNVTVSETVPIGTFLTNMVHCDYETSGGTAMPPATDICVTTVINPDIVLSKTGPATAEPGETLAYTITCTNVGTGMAYNLLVTEYYPVGETFVASVPAPDIGNNIWIISAITPGGSFTITVTMQVDLVASGNLTNTVAADYENGAGVPYRRWANWTTIVQAPGPVRAPIRINSNADFDAAHGVVDGAGSAIDPWIIADWEIDGTGQGYCIYVGNTTEHFTIRDCTLTNASGTWNAPYFTNSSIILYNAINGTVSNNTLTGNDATGVYLFASSGNLISQNNASNNGAGFYLHSSAHNTLSDNQAMDSTDSGIIFAMGSHNNSIIGNQLTGGYVGLYIRSYSNDAIVQCNTMENNDYGIEVVNVNNSVIANNDAISNGLYGIFLASSINNTIANNTASNSEYGIKLENSNYNVIASNNASENSWLGISLTGSDGNAVTGNVLSYNGNGICLAQGSTGNTIEGNIAVSGYWRGIWLDGSGSNTVIGNNASENGRSLNGGWGFYLNNSSNNTIANNTASSNAYYNVRLISSYGNEICRNDFYKGASGEQATDDGVNSWDAGYPFGGNYWSDHNATDIFSGPGQDIPGSDGICDLPYLAISGGDASDGYPLAQPHGSSPSGDVIAPFHSDEYPSPGGFTKQAAPTMSVRVTDWGTGVNASTMKFYIDGFMIFYEIGAIAGGFNVSYTHGSPYSDGQSITCRIAAKDYAGNTLDFTWHFTVDLTSPTVLSTYPQDGELNVSIAATINVTFSEVMNHASAESAFQMSPPTAGTFTWLGGVMFFAPIGNLSGGMDYSVAVGTGARDVAGNQMPANLTFAFRTESPVDEAAPSHGGETPAPGGQATNTTPVISVNVTDFLSGVDLSTVRLYVQGYSIMYDSMVIAGGYSVSYWHEGGFAHGAMVTCRIVARDFAGNLLDYTWTFTVP